MLRFWAADYDGCFRGCTSADKIAPEGKPVAVTPQGSHIPVRMWCESRELYHREMWGLSAGSAAWRRSGLFYCGAVRLRRGLGWSWGDVDVLAGLGVSELFTGFFFDGFVVFLQGFDFAGVAFVFFLL
jgi:hypothetical protein